MRASQWAERFQTSPTDKLVEELHAFIGEIGEVAGKRGGSVGAVESAVREQRSKWDAVLRLHPSLRNFGFDMLLQEFGPNFMRAAEKYRRSLDRQKSRHPKKKEYVRA